MELASEDMCAISWAAGVSMLRRILFWVIRVPEDHRLVSMLVWVNLLGAIYGFEWYRVQLLQTHIVYWPVVPDSPLSTLLFGLMLVALTRGNRHGLLEALAYLSMAKYGVWTLLIFSQAWAARGFAYWEELFLCGSHLAMAVESGLFYRVFAPSRNYLLVAGAWLLFNDYMDYVHGLHPFLPYASHLPSIRLYTPALSLLVMAAFIIARPRADQGAHWFTMIKTKGTAR